MEQQNFKGNRSGAVLYSRPAPAIVRWVVKYSGGLVQDEKTAGYTQLGSVIIVLIFSAVRIFHALQSPRPLLSPSTEGHLQLEHQEQSANEDQN